MNLNQSEPTIIIGLGGTGRWVLTMIKKNLLEIYGGQMPRHIRLLSFDTIKEGQSVNGRPIEKVEVGGVQLASSEYIHLGGQLYNLCQQIVNAESALPHVRSWLQAEHYLKGLPRDDFTIARGSGQRRPFGRMALFLDLQAHSQSMVVERINQALSEVSNGSSNVTFYVVASLSGGTGSGMFIDMAHLVRVLTQPPVTVRGFLVLQNTFGSVERLAHVELNTAAALRELDRFMHVFDQNYSITYSPDIPVRGKTVYGANGGRLFDGCYLIDADRERNPLVAYKPKDGVYPSIADSITTLLDPGVAAEFEANLSNIANRSSSAQLNKDAPHYSSIGTYTLVFPAEAIVTSLSYRFARELLSGWLLQIRSDNQSGIVRHTLTYEGNPKREASAFLQQPRSSDDLESSEFLRRIPTYTSNISSASNISSVASYSSYELGRWLILPTPKDSTTSRSSGMLVDEILNRRLHDAIQRAEPEVVGQSFLQNLLLTGAQLPSNQELNQQIFAQVAQFREETFGYNQEGRLVGGIYTEALERCVSEQQQRYTELLLKKLQELLASSKDPEQQPAQRGRFGFARDFLRALVSDFDRLAAFFEKVKLARNGVPPNPSYRQELQDEVDDLRREMDSYSSLEHRRFFPTWSRSWNGAERARANYIDAEQELITYEMGSLLIEALQKLAVILRDVTIGFRDEMENWTYTLVEGFMLDKKKQVQSLYEYIVAAETVHKRNREEDARLPVQEHVTDADLEEELYHSALGAHFQKVMERLTWEIGSNQSGGITIRLAPLQILRSDSSPEQCEQAHSVSMGFLIDEARGFLTSAVKKLHIADLIARRNDNPSVLARRLYERCSPLLNFDPNLGGHQEYNYYVCLNKGGSAHLFDALPEAFKQITNKARDYDVVSSADPHRCTVLALADVIPSAAIYAYAKASRAYDAYPDDARLLHIFPAEVNAVYYEQRLPEIFEERRRFSARLAAMMEDRRLLNQFVLCFLYDFITLQPVGSAESRYMLNLDLPEIAQSVARQLPRNFALTPAERQPSLAVAIETFIFRKADIDNTAKLISPILTEYTLRQYETAVSGGTLLYHRREQLFSVDYVDDDSEDRLINHIRSCLDDRVKLLESEEISISAPTVGGRLARDLVDLVKLVVQDIVQGIRLRKSARKQQNRRPLKLLFDEHWVALTPEGSAKPRNGVGPAVSNGASSNPLGAVLCYYSGGLVGVEHDQKHKRSLLDDLHNSTMVAPSQFRRALRILEIEEALVKAHTTDALYKAAVDLLEDARSHGELELDNVQILQRVLELDRAIASGVANQLEFTTLRKRIEELHADGTLSDEEEALRHKKLAFDWAERSKLLDKVQYAQGVEQLASRWSAVGPKIVPFG